MTSANFDNPTLSVHQVQHYMRQEASAKRRWIHALLLLFDAGVVVMLVALWSTETSLPWQTHLAFGAMLAVGLAWMGFFTWVLSRRRPLFALDKVIAGRLALMFTTLFLVGGIAVAAQRAQWRGLLMVVLVGGMFVAAAATILARALRLRRSLTQRREELVAAQIKANLPT
jgi:hypothetical protein